MSSEEQDDEEDEDEKENLFNNWVRGAQGLQHLKEGLRDFVGAKVQQCRDNTLLQIVHRFPPGAPQSCRYCTSVNLSPEHCTINKTCYGNNCIQDVPTNCYGSKPKRRRKCPDAICSKFYDAIVNDHSFKDPLWKNTDPSIWCSDPFGWSYAKCFQTTVGPDTSAKEADAADLLSIMINNKPLHNYMSYSSIYPITSSPYYKAREIRNKIFHSPELKIDETTLHSYLDTFIAVLEDPKYLLIDKAAKEAVSKLLKLKGNATHISQRDQMILFENRNKALAQLDEKVADGFRKLDNETMEQINRMKQNVGKIHTDAKQTIAIQASVAFFDIQKKKIDTQRNIASKTTEALTNIEKAETEAQQKITGQRNDALTDLEKAKIGAKQTISTQASDVISDIETANTVAQKKISSQANDVLNDVQKAKLLAQQKIAAHASDVLSDIAIAKTDAKVAGVNLHDEISTTISGLRQDLFHFYQNTCSKLPLTPVFEDNHTPLIDHFVRPSLNSIHLQTTVDGNETKTEVNSLTEFFKTQDIANREIYLTADAGFGKTALSKYLAMTWCHSYFPNDRFQTCFENCDLDCMKEFDLLFFVQLRDCPDECEIDDIIQNHVIRNLSRYCTLSKIILREVLHTTKYLVILDGLDEWTHPENECTRTPRSVPHRNEREQCTILTTSRPWKVALVSLSGCQIDKKIKMKKLSKHSAHLLEERIISKIKSLDLRKTQDLTNIFQTHITEAGLDDMETNPLLLLYIICLWCDDKKIGKSKSDLYCNIIELLLSRMEQKHGTLLACYKKPYTHVPEYFSNHSHCCKYFNVLLSLGKLALYTLLCKKRENSLVFNGKIAEQFLSNDDKNLCLLSGILTESKVKTLIHESSKFSFSHKTLQEFFFAIHASFQNTVDIQENILLYCNSVQAILDLSTVFIFISKMNPARLSSMSKRLMSVINNDIITKQYRTVTRYSAGYDKPLKDIQRMYIACQKECNESTELEVCLQDIFIDETSKLQSHFNYLQNVCLQYKDEIKSITIKNTGICSLKEMIILLGMTEHSNLEKIFYHGKLVEEEMINLLVEPLQCLSVIQTNWIKATVDEYCILSSKINLRLPAMHHLTRVNIGRLAMYHDQMETMIGLLSKKGTMKDFTLFDLSCIDHRTACQGVKIDLSEHTDLECLGLSNIPVSRVDMNVSSLKECEAGNMITEGVLESYLNKLVDATKLNIFSAFYIKSHIDMDAILRILPRLVNLKDIRLNGMHLGERILQLPPQMKNVEQIDLYNVKLSCLALKELLSCIDKLPRSVTVYMLNCKIKPGKEFVEFKTQIKNSGNYVILYDGLSQGGFYKCVLQKINSED